MVLGSGFYNMPQFLGFILKADRFQNAQFSNLFRKAPFSQRSNVNATHGTNG